jgi:hypothetical protein
MTKPAIERIDVSRDELNQLLERAKTALHEDDYRKPEGDGGCAELLDRASRRQRDDDSGPAPVAVATVDREDTRGPEASGHRPHAELR